MSLVTTFNPFGGSSIDWKPLSIANSYPIQSLYYANNIIIGITESSPSLVTPSTLVNQDPNYVINDIESVPPVARHPGHPPVPSYDNGKLIYSYDGIIWNDCVVPDDTYCYGKIVWGGDKFVKIGAPLNAYTKAVMYSYDGITWQYSILPSNANWCGLAYGAGKFITTQYTGDVFTTNDYAYSYDGINWIEVEFPFQHINGGPISYTNGYFIYGARDAANKHLVISSTDGLSWYSIGNVNKYILKSFVTPFQHYIYVDENGWYKSNGTDFVKVVNYDAEYANINWIHNRFFHIGINDYSDIFTPIYIVDGTISSTSSSFMETLIRRLPGNIPWCTPIYVEHLNKFLTMAYNQPYVATLNN